MNRFPTACLLTSLLAACSSSNTPNNIVQQNDPSENEPMGPVAGSLENGQQFNGSGRPAILAGLLALDVATLLNTLNTAIISGTTSQSGEAANCLVGFDAALGLPANSFTCGASIELSETTAEAFSGQVATSAYCDAALATQQAQNCALQGASVDLGLEWIVGATGTPSPLLATNISYTQNDMTLSITTPEQIGEPASNCRYDMANDGQPISNDDVAVCSARLNEVISRLDEN